PADQIETLTVEPLIPTVSSPVLIACLNNSPEPSNEARLISKGVTNQEETPSMDNILTLTNRFEDILEVTTSSDEAIGVEVDVNNMETTISASPTLTLRIHKDHPKKEQSFIAIIHQKTDPDLLQFCLFSCFLSQVEPKKGEFKSDFHPMVDFIAASPLRYALTVKPTIFVSHIRQFWSTARIETTDEGTHILATVDGIQRTVSESSLRRNLKLRDEDDIVSIPDTELFENLTLIGEGEACPTDSVFIADQDRETIAKSSTLPHDSAPRDDAPIMGRSINEGEAAGERISNDSEEVARVLTSMDATTVLAGG
nr:hypothetical protein [Tanacetum cinerariifolium]